MRYIVPIALSLSIVPFANSADPKARPRVEQKFTAESVNNATYSRELGPRAHDPVVLRAQVLLDRAHYSPGEIDATFGDDMLIALIGFQDSHKLKPSGRLDEPTWKALTADSGPVLDTYAITAADIEGPYEPTPATMPEQAKLARLGYQSIYEQLGEKFHIEPKLLVELNRGKSFTKPGEKILIPKIREPLASLAARIVVSKSKRTVTALDDKAEILLQYPATIGSQHDPLPLGSWKVVTILRMPPFYYDPNLFWDAKPTDEKLKLPPGPNNPVGVVWIGLSKPNYGIHGTPDPGGIGHAQSHGCIRLTNWDAEELSHLVKAGLPVILEE